MSFGWLKHYVPRGIYGRAALILLLPVVTLQLVVTVIFAQRHFEGVTHQMSDTVLRELDLVLRAVDRAPNRSAVPQAVEAQTGPLKIDVRGVEAGAVPDGNPRLWYDYSGSVLTPRLAAQLGGLQAVDLSPIHPPVRSKCARRVRRLSTCVRGLNATLINAR